MSTILLVTPNEKNRGSFREYLLLEGYQVLEAASDEEALVIWQEQRPEMLIVDASLPDGGAMRVLKTVRAQSAKALIIMLSSRQTEANEEQEIEAFNEKVDDYIARPISVRVLLKRIQRRIEQQYEMGEVIALGHLTISHAAYQVWWRREALALTSKEFELLWTLAKSRDRVLTRSQLLDSVWGYDYIGDERVVDAHIKNLRHKLPVNVIRTVKGRGYTLSQKLCFEENEKENGDADL